MFYTHYSKFKNQIYVRYVNKQNQRSQKYFDFQPSIYTLSPNPNTDVISLYGESVYEHKVPMETVYEFLKKMGEENCYGSKKTELQFIHKAFKDTCVDTFNSDYIVRHCIDIETEVDGGKFPDPDLAEQKITLLTSLNNQTKEIHFFHFDPLIDIDFIRKKVNEENPDFEFIEVKALDEKTMLIKYIEYIERDYPDIISGWNVELFDVKYIVNRIKKLFNEKTAKRLSPVGNLYKRKTKDQFDNFVSIYVIQGIEIIDTMKMYKKLVLSPRENYRLDYISEVELEKNKLSHPSKIEGHLLYREFNPSSKNEYDWGDEYKDVVSDIKNYLELDCPSAHKNIQRHFHTYYGLYNIIDVIRCYEIEEEKSLFEIIYFLSYYTYTNFFDSVDSSQRVWENLLYAFALNKGKVFQIGKPENVSTTYAGGYVRPVKSGLYKGVGSVVTFDLASLYPSIIRLLNISPETLLEKVDPYDVDELLQGMTHLEFNDDECIAINGAKFSKKKQGIIPEKIDELFFIRQDVKREMRKLDSEIKLLEKELERRNDNTK